MCDVPGDGSGWRVLIVRLWLPGWQIAEAPIDEWLARAAPRCQLRDSFDDGPMQRVQLVER
ncbi:MAG: DUF488 family protein, N3 subclade [Acidimicrobiales bacterium]